MKLRADQLVVKQGLTSSREKAKALILAGKVFSAKGRVDKVGELLDEGATLEVKEGLKFVSRGGIKLDHALTEFKVNVSGKVCLDVGASTGGFTDCLLQRGAKKVYAVDVGYGQFEYKLRQDPRIVLLERTNFRYINPEKIPEPVDFAVIDVSFISLTKILPKVKRFLKEGGEAVALVKPQFELTPAEVKKGVVRSDLLRQKAVSRIEGEAKKLGFKILGQTKSPILGPKGNQEYFLHLLAS
jgi:23S rRNA (cytidine1920-2'-O)/16S rRNA (cytidine1409-2'-O)-methyltransferase